MTFNPNVGRSGNTVTAQYNTTQAETPKQPTGKQEQVLKALESALPFFDASDYGLKADKGKADTPPVHTGGGKGNNSVKDFFKSIGKAISSGFEKIGDFFKSIGKAEAKPTKDTVGTTPPTRYGDTKVVDPNIKTANQHRAGGQLAFAFVSGGQEGLTKMVGDLASKLNTEMVRANFEGTIPEFVEQQLGFTSELGYALEGQTATDIKQLVPQMKVQFADNPVALAVLDAVESFDFHASLQQDFTSQVDKLSSEHNPLGSFLRSNNDTSLGLVALAVSDGFDQSKLANQILTPHMTEMADLQKSMDQLEPHERKKEELTGENATKMMDLTNSILTDSLKTEGPGNLVETFGQDHIDRLNDLAQQIAIRDDLPKDVRNQAIQTLYVDQLFLRTTMPALMATAKHGTVEATAVTLAQSIVNGAGGGKLQSQDMRDAYSNVARDFHQNFVQAMIELGMPVVP